MEFSFHLCSLLGLVRGVRKSHTRGTLWHGGVCFVRLNWHRIHCGLELVSNSHRHCGSVLVGGNGEARVVLKVIEEWMMS